MRHLKTIAELPAEDIKEILAIAREVRLNRQNNLTRHKHTGRMLAQLYEKPSLRTRAAFESAANDLAMGTMVFRENEVFLAGDGTERESISDILRNLEGFSDIILIRTSSHDTIRKAADISRVPIINGLCDRHHPTQALCDLLTITDHFGRTEELKVAFVGDGNNVATSLAQICEKSGIRFSIATPKGFGLPAEIAAELSNAEFTHNPFEAVRQADVVYTDTWVSMGWEEERAKRETIFRPYTVTQKLIDSAKPDAVFMHCLPSHRGYEVETEVIDGPHSLVFRQAHARRDIAAALMIKLLKENRFTR